MAQLFLSLVKIRKQRTFKAVNMDFQQLAGRNQRYRGAGSNFSCVLITRDVWIPSADRRQVA